MGVLHSLSSYISTVQQEPTISFATWYILGCGEQDDQDLITVADESAIAVLQSTDVSEQAFSNHGLKSSVVFNQTSPVPTVAPSQEAKCNRISHAFMIAQGQRAFTLSSTHWSKTPVSSRAAKKPV